MKYLILLAALLLWEAAYAQLKLEEQIPLQGARQLILRIDDTELIHIDTWEQTELAITGSVSINENENNDAFQVSTEREAQTLTVKAAIENEDSLPERIMLHQGGQDYVLNASSTNDAVVQQFIREKGGYEWMSRGVQKDIELRVLVPRNTPLRVESAFGTIEIARVSAPMVIESKFGDIDVSISPQAALSLTSRTEFGTVYTDLDWEIEKRTDGLTQIKGNTLQGTLNGGGTPLELHARFGNVFLRAGQN